MKFRIRLIGANNGTISNEETYIVCGENMVEAENVAVAAFERDYGEKWDMIDVVYAEEVE